MRISPSHAALLCSGALVLAACNDNTPMAPADSGDVTVEEFLPEEAPLYSGSRGFVIDTREIFRLGYEPQTVEVTFANYPDLDQTLDVDPLTNLAILVVENDSLTAEQRDAFDQGAVATTFVVRGVDPGAGASMLSGPMVQTAGGVVLASSSASRAFDASNRPISVRNDTLPERAPAYTLSDQIGYLLVTDPDGTVVTRTTEGTGTVAGVALTPWPYPSYQPRDTTATGERRLLQRYYFRPVDGKENTYTIHSFTWPALGTDLTIRNNTLVDPNAPQPFTAGFVGGGGRFTYQDFGTTGPDEFQVIQAGGGRVRIFNERTGTYLSRPNAPDEFEVFGRRGWDAWTPDSTGIPFRLLADVDVTAEDLGTSFSQPVVPPARLAFAAESVIRNCSAATVREVVGRDISRATTKTHVTTESLQFVNSFSRDASFELSWSSSVKWEPGDVGGIGGGGTVSHEYGSTVSLSTEVTRDTITTFQADTTEVVQLSRTRQVEVGPGVAVKVVEWVRTVEDMRLPWTQTLRIRGQSQSNNAPVSGADLLTLMRSNRSTAIPIEVGPDYLDVTVRGESTTDDFYQSETVVRELGGACRGGGV